MANLLEVSQRHYVEFDDRSHSSDPPPPPLPLKEGGVSEKLKRGGGSMVQG